MGDAYLGLMVEGRNGRLSYGRLFNGVCGDECHDKPYDQEVLSRKRISEARLQAPRKHAHRRKDGDDVFRLNLENDRSNVSVRLNR